MKEIVTMNENRERKAPETISYYEHEEEIFRMERHLRRLWIALLVAIALLFLTNAGWLIYESMFDTINYTQDGADINNINTGEQGNVSSDGTKTKDKDSEKPEQGKGAENKEATQDKQSK